MFATSAAHKGQIRNNTRELAMLADAIVVAAIGLGLAWTQAKLHGPFGWNEKIRRWAIENFSQLDAAGNETNWIAIGFTCSACLSFWFCAVGAALVGPADAREFIALWLAGFGIILALWMYTGLIHG